MDRHGAFGLAGLLVLLAVQGLRLPRDGRTPRACAVVGLFNTTLPSGRRAEARHEA